MHMPSTYILLAAHHLLQSFIKLVPAGTMVPSVAAQAVNDNIIIMITIISHSCIVELQLYKVHSVNMN